MTGKDKKQRDSDGAVVVVVVVCALPHINSTHAHAHTLTFSGYLGRQVAVPLPVAKQLPSPLPLQHAHNVFFFPQCVYVCVREKAFIKPNIVNKTQATTHTTFSCSLTLSAFSLTKASVMPLWWNA